MTFGARGESCEGFCAPLEKGGLNVDNSFELENQVYYFAVVQNLDIWVKHLRQTSQFNIFFGREDVDASFFRFDQCSISFSSFASKVNCVLQ